MFSAHSSTTQMAEFLDGRILDGRIPALLLQVVLEGFLQINIPPWLRRLVTRLVSVIPAAIVAGVAGNKGAGKLLVLSQVPALLP